MAERYEELRRRALGGEPEGFRLGMAVLERRGLAAWIGAWSDIAAVPAPAPTPPVTGTDEMVAVLASMAMACAGGG